MEVIAITFLSIIDWLTKIDRRLFVLVHAEWSSPKLDWLFKLMRDPLTWVPLYAFVLYWIIRYYKRYAWQFVLMTLVVFAITDFTSASVLKPMFMRLRPCFDPSLDSVLRVIVTCGGKYGMPSSHAANHFGLASFWYFSITWMSKRKWSWLWAWAFLVCYAQVYVGKHFPGDVFVGGILGTAVGTLFAMLFRKWMMRGENKKVKNV
jgi:membrane-associated phospholipid phosphatase